MLAASAFASTGFLIGLMVAFSSDQLSRVLIPLMFALFGGSVLTIGKDMSAEQRRNAYAALLSISLACLVGIVLGIVALRHSYLGAGFFVDGRPSASDPKDNTAERKPSSAASGSGSQQGPFYLRAQTVDQITAIRIQVSQGQLDKAAAYDQLTTVLDSSAK